jgi:hypothetical protein
MTTHTRTFPGVAENVRAAREFTRGAFTAAGGACYTGNAVLIVSELAANAIHHTASGNPGGTFTVTITSAPGTILLEVTDDGAAGHAVPLVPRAASPARPRAWPGCLARHPDVARVRAPPGPRPVLIRPDRQIGAGSGVNRGHARHRLATRPARKDPS